MRKALYVVLALFVAVTACSRDESKKTLAKVGSRKITVGDFREAYMKVPPGYLPQATGEEGKRQFLDDLVNKELLVLEAYERELDKDEEVTSGMKRMEQQVLLRDLYNDQILEKSKVTDREIKARYEEMTRQDEVRARHVVVTDSLKALEVLKKARAGGDFAELAKEYSEDPSTAALGGDLGFFAQEPEDSSEFFQWAFRLKPGEISEIFRTPFGWHIVKVEERRKRQLDPYEKLKTRLESMLIMTKRRDLATAFLNETREKHKFELKEDAIKKVADAVQACTTAVGATPEQISRQFPEAEKDLPLATMKEGNYTIGDFIGSLEAAQITSLPPTTGYEDVKSMVESEAITEPLVLEARRLGVHKKKNVKSDLARLKEEKMVDLLYGREVRDSVKVTDQEVYEYFTEHAEDYGTPAVFKVLKLVVDTQTTADSLAALARSGTDFKVLVRDNSIDAFSKRRDGETDITAGRDAIIDALIENAKIGEIAGPADTREGFMLLKLLSKKPPVPTPLEMAWPHVQNDVRRMKEEEALQSLLERLRDNYKPEIDEEVLVEVKLGAEPEAAKSGAQ